MDLKGGGKIYERKKPNYYLGGDRLVYFDALYGRSIIYLG